MAWRGVRGGVSLGPYQGATPSPGTRNECWMQQVLGGGWFPMTGYAFPVSPDGGTQVPVLPRGLLPLLWPEANTDDGALRP